MIGGTVILINMLCSRKQRIALTLCEIGLVYWLGPPFIKAALFNHGVFLMVYLLSLEIVPSFMRELEAGRD